MSLPADWDPRAQPVLDDQIAAYDAMRRRCPVAHSDYLHWSLFRHADVLRVLHDPAGFSSMVSARVSVPSGVDPPAHARYRAILDPYFAPAPMQAFEPVCRGIAAALLQRLPRDGELELMADFADEFAVRVQCAFLGWPEALCPALCDWIRRSQAATLAHDRALQQQLGREFDALVRALLDARRTAGAAAPDDATTRLLHERLDGRALDDEELLSILRNWTAGELGTIAACVGIVALYLAERPALQQRLAAAPVLLPAAIDEILRLHAPLISNRRVATRAVDIGGRRIEAGARLTLMWASANRDEAVFGDPDEFRLDRDPALNLLYGAGIHVCPGAPLARLELRLVFEVLLAERRLAVVPGKPPSNAVYPAGGFASLPLRLSPAAR